MKLLIVGGTRFLGRHLVDVARARGHAVTLFNRGRSAPPPAGVESLVGDRADDLAALQSGTWDAAIDTCGYLPRDVARVAAALQGPAPLVLWGAGTLSAQLLANTALAGAGPAVAGLLDIDPKKHGLQLEGRPVWHPDSAEGQALLAQAGQLVIGSWSSQEAIYQGLVARGIAAQRIVRLFGR